MLQPGERIGPLRIERPLGVGGMGEVWLARDERLERLVAVKLLPEDRSVDPAARGRMLREARAASALKHPSIVTVHDIGDHDGRAFIVMEYVEGETFEALVRRRGRVPPAEAVDLLGQVADAVAVAHTAGILHRDLKAANLMIDDAGRVKVLDFGLSKRTDGASQAPEDAPPLDAGPVIVRASGPSEDVAVAATAVPDSASAVTTPAPSLGSSAGRTDEPKTAFGARMGTPGWAPPELIDGRPSDVRSDVFSLGVVLYHLLSGRMPFPGTEWAELREQIERRAVPPSQVAPEVPRALDEVVLAALDPDPARRPDSARALVSRARAALVPPRSRSWMLVGLGAVAAGGIAVALVVSGSDEPPAAAPARPAAGADAPPAGPPTPVQLTRLGGCAYSPAFLDDDTLSFDLTRDGTVDLYTLDLGGEPVRRTDLPGWEWRSVRGADPSEVLFAEDSGGDASFATRLDLDDGTLTRLFPSAGPIALAGDSYFYSPAPANVLRRRQGSRDEAFLTLSGNAIDTIVASHDGESLALMTFGDNQRARICVTPVARPDLRCLDAGVGSSRPAWSSRGDAVYADGRNEVVRLPVDNGPGTTAVAGVENATGGIAVSPSGAHLVFSDCITRGQLRDVTGDPDKPILDEADVNHPVFGAGGRLAYLANDRRQQRVMVRDPDGTLREVARHPDARVTGLAFSKDGQHLAYVVDNRSEPGIYVARLDSGATPNRITENDGDREPRFVGDGLVFTRADASGAPRLMRVSLDGSSLELASKRPREALAVDDKRGRVLLAAPAGDFLYWWDPATGKESKGPVLPQPLGDVAISPDGTWLVALEGENGNRTHRLRLDGAAELETIYELPGDLTSGSCAIDDAGHAVIVLFRWVGELWQVDAPPGAPW